jgi:hypothetical protein
MGLAGQDYFKGRVIWDGRVLHYVVWDGVWNFCNAPPFENIKDRYNLHQVIYLKIDPAALGDIWHLLAVPLHQGDAIDGLVVWTRDHATYQATIKRLEACLTLAGAPKRY